MANKPGNTSAVTHGVYSYVKRGDAALDETGRSRTAEIRELVQTKQGLMDLMRTRVERAEMITELAEAHITEQARAGQSADKIPMLDKITTFQGNAQRAIALLYSMTPDERGQITAMDVLDAIRGQDDTNKPVS